MENFWNRLWSTAATMKQSPGWHALLVRRVALLWLLPLAHAALSASPSDGSATVEDLAALQQDIRLLKVLIERLRLQREVIQLQSTTATATNFCPAHDGLGTLVLTAIYGTGSRYLATFAYNSTTQITVGRGEPLLCGEIVRHLTLEGVDVEKNGTRYRLTSGATPTIAQQVSQTPPLSPRDATR